MDLDWFVSEYPQAVSTGATAASHFRDRGWRQGRNPRADFDVAFYLIQYPDVFDAGVNPFVHFLRHGRREGRSPVPTDEFLFNQTILASEFDHPFYLDTNPDVRAAGVDAFFHYRMWGWREGRAPNADFDPVFYIERYADVAAAGINPFLHYLLAGRLEGRMANRVSDGVRTRIKSAKAVALQERNLAGLPVTSTVVETEPVTIEFNAPNGLVVSISHDDYIVSVGGVQNVVRDEADAFQSAGWDYLHLSPPIHISSLRPDEADETAILAVRLNDRRVGSVSLTRIRLAIKNAPRRPVHIIVHHLMGHAPEMVTRLAEAVATAKPIFWVHDFFGLCPSFTLLRNDIAFCAAPPIRSGACFICSYHDRRADHEHRMAAMLAAVRPIVLAPSKSALDRWQSKSPVRLRQSEVVAPCRLALSDAPSIPDAMIDGRPLRIAHVGSQGFHKGWSVFLDLARARRHDPRYSFHLFGENAESRLPANIAHVPVRVNASNRNAMVDAVAREGIDVVVNWPLWPETFNYAVHEALAGGAFVVTKIDSGNVWPAISQNAPDHGIALETPADLQALFENGEILGRVAASTKRFGRLIFGKGAAERILKGRRSHRQHAGGSAQIMAPGTV